MKREAAAWSVGILALALASGLGAGGCSQRKLDAGDLGSVVVALTLPGGGTISTVNYQITGNGITPISGTIDVSAPGTTEATALVSGLTPGTYLVTMSAIPSTPGTCAGTAPFTVVAGQTAMATVILQCARGEKISVVAVRGQFDQCPFITSFTATSLMAQLGGSITVGAVASDPDPGDVVTYTWTANPSAIGTFAPNGATATFHCNAAGSTQLTIAVTDGICGDSLMNAIPVTCLGAASGGGGGSEGGTAGGARGGTTGGGGGTVGTVGTGGFGGDCASETNPPPALRASCFACLSANANPATDGCCTISAADTTGLSLCQTASVCIRAGGPPVGQCNQAGDTTSCFCGNHLATCDQPGQANGPCVSPMTNAAGYNLVTMATDAPSAAQVLARAGDPTYALGRAVNIQTIAGAFCTVECGYAPSGAAGAGGSPGTGGMAGTGGAGGAAGRGGTGGMGGAAGAAGAAGAGATGGVAGTVGTGPPVTGIGGFPASCLETNPPPTIAMTCDSCIVNNYNPQTDGCCPIFNTDPSGYTLCQTASACMRAGGPPVGVCNIGGDVTDCYCGTNAATCDQPGAANGPCVAQLTAAAGHNVFTMATDSPNAAQVLARFGDFSYAIGRAVNIQAIAGAFCPAECGF